MERVQPRHRLLEDQPELRPAQPAELLRRQPDEVPPAVQHLRRLRDAPVGEQAEDAAAERRLAAARLADQAEHLAGADVERHAVDRPHRPARRCRSRPRRSRTERTGASLTSPPPRRRSAARGSCSNSTLIDPAPAQHRVHRLVQPLAEQREPGDEQDDREPGEEAPSTRSRTRRPRPPARCRSPTRRRRSAGCRSRGTRAQSSRRIASAALRVAIGGTFWMTLWKTYLRMIVNGSAPSARAASTYVSSRERDHLVPDHAEVEGHVGGGDRDRRRQHALADRCPRAGRRSRSRAAGTGRRTARP